jgi:hypothetical protein
MARRVTHQGRSAAIGWPAMTPLHPVNMHRPVQTASLSVSASSPLGDVGACFRHKGPWHSSSLGLYLGRDYWPSEHTSAIQTDAPMLGRHHIEYTVYTTRVCLFQLAAFHTIPRLLALVSGLAYRGRVGRSTTSLHVLR